MYDQVAVLFPLHNVIVEGLVTVTNAYRLSSVFSHPEGRGFVGEVAVAPLGWGLDHTVIESVLPGYRPVLNAAE